MIVRAFPFTNCRCATRLNTRCQGSLFQGHRVPQAVPGDCQGGGRPGGEGTAYGNLGNAYRSALGRWELFQVTENQGQHLAIAKDVGDRAGEGRAYGKLGSGHMDLIDFDKAVAYFKAQHAMTTSLKVAHES